MKVTLKSDRNNRLGFVEKYHQYFYDHRKISVLCMADVGGYFSEPFVMRGEEFIPAAQIEEEMGLEKYIKAKKPFYSVIGTGNVIVSAKIAMTLGENPEYLPENSAYALYYIDKSSLVNKGSGVWEANLKRVPATSDKIEQWFHEIGKKFAECGNDREVFLKSRFGE